MGTASLAGRTFRIDPTSVEWGFNSKVVETPTIGGKVIQVFGTTITDIQVAGTFSGYKPAGGRFVEPWQEQEEFLKEMKKLGDQQVEASMVSRSRVNPHRFLYPSKGWDFLVYLKGYSSPDGSKSIVVDPQIVAPKWELTLFVVEDNTGLRKIAEDAYISRLSKGLGWKLTHYNGPGTAAERDAMLNGLSTAEYLAFGPEGDPARRAAAAGGVAGAVSDAAGSVAGSLISGSTKEIGKQMAAAMGWTGAEWDALEKLWDKESGWNPYADNPTSSAYGIPQALIALHKMPAGYYESKTGSGANTKGQGGDARVQIQWGLDYIKQRYGSPSKAWAFHQANGHY